MTYGYPPPPPMTPPPGPWPAQPGYGVPYGAPVHRVANPAGIAVALIGGVVTLLGAFLDWYTDVQLADIVNALDRTGAEALPKAYFGWLMWVVLAATVVAALFANLPHGGAAGLRVISPLLGAVGAVMVVVSLSDLIVRGSVFDHSDVGLYLTLVGFVVAGVGGLLGPRRAPY